MVELRVLNLNFWGIPFISKDRQERLKALVTVLGEETSGAWDLVVLEEVWSDTDYRFIVNRVQAIYPHSHYFYSGVIGSGVCVLSKGQITSVLSHIYSLNGYAHKLNHGDWFGGKVVGLCKIFHKGLMINLYATHIHAEYNRKSDEYLPHRITQAYELSQFIRMTNAAEDDVNIIAGDFNFEPDDLGYAIVRRFADLKDSWPTRLNVDVKCDGNTCNTADNIYSILEDSKDKIPRGKRIDFIMYGSVGDRTSVVCSSSQTVLNKIPNSKLCYSDHKGVEAVLQVGHAVTEYPDIFSPAIGMPAVPNFFNTFDSALEVLDTGLRRADQNRKFFFAIMLLAFGFLIGTGDIEFHSWAVTRWLMQAVRMFLVTVMGWCFWTAAISYRIEYHALLATKNAMIIQRKWEDAHANKSGKIGERQLSETALDTPTLNKENRDAGRVGDTELSSDLRETPARKRNPITKNVLTENSTILIETL